ncbi:MAG TPA: DUF4287 domain-containing protein [Ilumatobacteraceae bacterium]|nr:DUF4287 domain-containing protein [Ilumatobacteraceae bacterium]
MGTSTGDRAQHFPAIERKHGKPIAFWLDRLADLDDDTYPAQMAHLRETHGFSRTHANAVVMYQRGSTSSRRFADADDWFAATNEPHARTARRIFDTITAEFPELELVMAWNHPMLRHPDGQYIFGLSASTNHLTLNPWSTAVLDRFADRIDPKALRKHTYTVPLDGEIDGALIVDMVAARLAELAPD